MISKKEITGEIIEVFPMKKEVKLINKIKHLLRKAGIPRFLHHFGPKKYEFYAHMFALFVKQACKLSFRRVAKLLNMLGFEVPTYSALCKMQKRIPLWMWQLFLKATCPEFADLCAVDSTGFSNTNPSIYFIKRIKRLKPIKRYTKLSAFFDTRRKKFLAIRIRAKPRHDIKDVNYLIKKFSRFRKLLGDSAYDAEFLHKLAYEKEIITVIKPRKNVKRGAYRRKQMKSYRERTYHRRSMIESGFGSIKRKYGNYVSGKSIMSRRAEIYCKAILHNLNLMHMHKIFN